jgi:hypothetical protein
MRQYPLAAAERQQLTGEAARAVGRLQDFAHVLAPGVRCLQRVHDQLAVAADGGQQVVEVVRDAAGQPADGLHLLRLP